MAADLYGDLGLDVGQKSQRRNDAPERAKSSLATSDARTQEIPGRSLGFLTDWEWGQPIVASAFSFAAAIVRLPESDALRRLTIRSVWASAK